MKQDYAKPWIYIEQTMTLPTLAKGITLLILCSTLLSSLAACVSTPTLAPVTSKQQGIQVKDNTQGAQPLLGAPSTITEKSMTKGAVTLNVNATLQLPPTGKIPVVTVQPEHFTQETVDKIIQTLMKGKPLYQKSFTRPDLQQHIILSQAMMWHVSPSDEQTQILPVITWSKLATENLPETEPLVPMTSQLQPEQDGAVPVGGKQVGQFQGKVLHAAANVADGYQATLDIKASDGGKTNEIQFTNHPIAEDYTYSDLTGNARARGMTMSLDQAKTLAQTTLQAIGATGLGIAKVELGTLIPLTKNGTFNTINQAYAFYFTRDVSGVLTTVDLTNADEMSGAYEAAYPYERAFIVINDTGVVNLTWTSPMKTTGTISANAQIISLNNAMNIFKEQFFTHYGQSDTSKGRAIYTIDHITLGMMRVQIKDQLDQYMMIPVWDFYGNASGATTSADSGHTLHSFLTISALDGSTIDRTLGY